jgi:diguanylate cyclase (GGDEF)-like protein
MHAGRATPASLLGLLYGVSGALCLFGAAHPMTAATPVPLLRVLAAVGLGAGAALWWFRHRARPAVLHAAVAGMSLLIGLLAWQSVTAVGIVGLGPIQIAIGLFTAYFFPPRAARVHVLLLVAVASLGAYAAEPTGFLAAWLPVVVATAVITDIQARLAEQLRRAADTDPLTGVHNRRAWELQTERNIAHAARTGEPLSVAILDLDDFKEVNDRHGHGAGDDLLRELTDRWRPLLRRADVLGRYGGDEFVLCLPATDHDGATELLQRLAAAHGFGWSSGVAAAEPGDTITTVLARADADLYRQKQGRQKQSRQER